MMIPKTLLFVRKEKKTCFVPKVRWKTREKEGFPETKKVHYYTTLGQGKLVADGGLC